MPFYVAFLRAVNVGGRFVRIAELRSALEVAGFTDVATHIQSGNVFVRSPRRSTAAVGTEMAAVLGEFAGFDVPCIVRTPVQLRAALAPWMPCLPSSRVAGATSPSPTAPCRRPR